MNKHEFYEKYTAVDKLLKRITALTKKRNALPRATEFLVEWSTLDDTIQELKAQITAVRPRMKKTKRKLLGHKTQQVYYDWKDTAEAGEEFRRALRAFGLHVYRAPSCEGSDTYGFIVSNKPMTKAKLRKLEGL